MNQRKAQSVKYYLLILTLNFMVAGVANAISVKTTSSQSAEVPATEIVKAYDQAVMQLDNSFVVESIEPSSRGALLKNVRIQENGQEFVVKSTYDAFSRICEQFGYSWRNHWPDFNSKDESTVAQGVEFHTLSIRILPNTNERYDKIVDLRCNNR